MKLKKIEIKNFRGAMLGVELEFKQNQSCLIYGDNGTGKSTIADAIEWFISDKISHLSGEEVGTHEGIKNTLSDPSSETSVALDFTLDGLKAKKILKKVKDKLRTEFVDGTAEFKPLIEEFQKERIWIRNRELVSFIINTKSQRLIDFSEIIGYEHVLKIKEHLKRSVSDIKTLLKNKNYEEQIANEKHQIVKQLGCLVHTKEQFLEACSTLIEPIEDKNISSFSELMTLQTNLEKNADVKVVKNLSNLELASGKYNVLFQKLTETVTAWAHYQEKRAKLSSNAERLKGVSLSGLLNQAAEVLAYHEEDNCPVCLQPISRDTLKREITSRIKDLEDVQNELKDLEAEKGGLLELSRQTRNEIDSILLFLIDYKKETEKVVKSINEIKDIFIRWEDELQKLTLASQLSYDASKIDDLNIYINELKTFTENELTIIRSKTTTTLTEIASKLAVARSSFEKIITLESEAQILKQQQETLMNILSKFTEAQKIGMESFLNCISSDMNELYLFMNKDEKIDNIRLESLLDENTNEFKGLTVKVSFHGQEVIGPKKFLSESHLNCLGLCMFLSCVRRFNNQSSFLILDDVISSFDKNHRTLFARLLIEKFFDYQLIILTHETEWFNYLSSLAKGRGWLVLKSKWTSKSGLWLEPTPKLFERIETKFATKDEHDLGNLLRRYSEKLLKDICYNLEVPIPFRPNDKNEERTFEELFSSIRRSLNNMGGITKKSEFNNLGSCQFFSNKLSHDNSYNPNISDLTTVWEDVRNFESLFKCKDCHHLVSLANKNVASKQIACNCGTLKIDWKFH